MHVLSFYYLTNVMYNHKILNHFLSISLNIPFSPHSHYQCIYTGTHMSDGGNYEMTTTQLKMVFFLEKLYLNKCNSNYYASQTIPISFQTPQ